MPTPEAQRSRSRVARTATIFVVLALAALVLVPALVQRRVYALRREIDAAGPARELVLQLQFSLAREMSSLTEQLLAGDTVSAARVQQIRETEDRIFRRLRPLAASLGPAIEARLAAVEEQTLLWHLGITDTALAAGRARGESLRELRDPAQFEGVLRTTAQLDSAIIADYGRIRDAIQQAEQTGLRLVFVLGGVALLASIAVARLYGGMLQTAEVSELRRQEAERALQESARANAARARLIRGVTHDVKNPLGAAKGLAELLAMEMKGPVAPEQREFLDRIKRLLDEALAIVTDLLDVARSDSGALTVQAEPVDAATLVLDAADAHRGLAEATGHELTVDIDLEGMQLQTDALRVHQVLGNLLTNAIKYTPPPGRIAVKATRAESRRAPGDGPWAVIEVSDTGPGIPPELQETIFEEYTRVDPSSAIKGHGLGLTIARRVARLLGGDLAVNHGALGGATFVFWLPATPPSAAAAAEEGAREEAATAGRSSPARTPRPPGSPPTRGG